MYIKRIDFTRVGRCTGRSYELAPGLNIVFGRNEAGKTTARRAIEATLFTPGQAELTSLAAPQPLPAFEAAIHARRVLDADGSEESLVLLRKGRHLLAGGQPASPELLDAWLPGTSLVDYRALYSLDGAGLRSPDLLSRKHPGSFGALILELETGGRDLPAIRSALQEELEKLYKKGGRNQVFARLLEGMNAIAARRNALEQLAGYSPYRRAIDEQMVARQGLIEHKEARRRMRDELEALIGVQDAPVRLERLGEDEAARAALLALQSPVSEIWCAALQKIESRIEVAMDASLVAEAGATAARGACVGRLPSSAFFLRDREVTEVVARSGDLATEPQKRLAAEKRRDACALDLLEVLRPVPVEADKEWVLANIDALTAVGRGARLGATHRAFAAKSAALEITDAAARTAARDLALREREAADVGPSLDVDDLEGAMKEGLLAREALEVAEITATVETERKRLARLAGHLGFSDPGDLDACAAARVPELAACTSIANRWKAAGATVEAAAHELTRCTREHKGATAAHERLLRRAPRGVAREEIAPRRAKRDAAIQACEARGGKAEFRSLRAVEGELDDVTDTVLDNAQLSEELRHARLDAEAKLAAQKDATAQLAVVEHARAAIEEEWARRWKNAGVATPSVEGHDAFRRDHASFIADVGKMRASEMKLAVRLAALHARRTRLLGLLGESGGKKTATLPDATIDARLDSERRRRVAQNKERDQARTRLEDSRRAAGAAQAALDEDRAAFAYAEEAFRACVEGDAPGFVARDLDVAGRWVVAERTVCDRAVHLRDAILALAEHDQTWEARRGQVSELVSLLADAGHVSLDALRGASIASQIEELRRVQAAARETARLEAGLADADRELAAATREHEAALSQWRAHFEGVELGAPESPLSDESHAFVLRAKEILEAEKRITTNVSSFSGALERAKALVAGRSTEAIETEILERRSALDAFDDGPVKAAEQRLARAGEAITLIEGTTEVAALTQELEGKAASFLVELDEILALEGAIALLDEAERLVQGRQIVTAVLASANRYLARLTRGSMAELVLDDEVAAGAEHAKLQVIRNDDAATPMELAQLSDGTQDQQWLALRLAFLEHNLGHKRLPIMLDDVLVNFDDVRGTAALAAFAELAKHTQVLLFTHEPAILERARAAGIAFHEVILPDVEVRGDVPEAHVLEPVMPAARTVREVRSKSDRVPRGDGAAEEVYSVLAASVTGPMGRSQILERLPAVDAARFAEAIRRLKEDGRIVQIGERRGAKYAVAGAYVAGPAAGGTAA